MNHDEMVMAIARYSAFSILRILLLMSPPSPVPRVKEDCPERSEYCDEQKGYHAISCTTSWPRS